MLSQDSQLVVKITAPYIVGCISSSKILGWSPMFQCTNVLMFKCSIVQMFKSSNVKCQMSNVNKANFLSERNSGVPPVIFG